MRGGLVVTDTLTATVGTVQLVDECGARVASADLDPVVADIGDAELLALYRDMCVVRRIDDEATALQRQGELALWPPLRGQEAAQVGSARSLSASDFVFSSYREHAVAFVRGVALGDLVRVWRGVAASGWDPYAVRMATPQVIIGAQSLHATGWALGAMFEGSSEAAVAYFGDGAMSEGDVSEAMVFAASYKAPVVFFCQNNHWAISEPVALQSTVPLVDRGAGFGIPSVRVDGNDVLAVLAVTRNALERARSGGGPTFIEAVTYRMGPHTTADDPTRYRPADELAEWAQRDPIERLGRLLSDRGVLTEETSAEVKAVADSAAAGLRSACIGMPDPDALTVFDHVYAQPHSLVDRERAEYASYLESFEQ